MSDIQIGPANSYITISPTYQFDQAKNKDNQDVRTKAGALYSYRGAGEFTKYTIPITWVTSSDRSLVNSWWETATDLRLLLDSDFPSSFQTVRITGKKEPFTKFVRPYFQVHYRGKMIVETI